MTPEAIIVASAIAAAIVAVAGVVAWMFS